jgi:hypothetical protein
MNSKVQQLCQDAKCKVISDANVYARTKLTSDKEYNNEQEIGTWNTPLLFPSKCRKKSCATHSGVNVVLKTNTHPFNTCNFWEMHRWAVLCSPLKSYVICCLKYWTYLGAKEVPHPHPFSAFGLSITCAPSRPIHHHDHHVLILMDLGR